MTVLERLLKYVVVDTTSDPTSGTHPSSSRQFNLAKLLEAEMNELGIKKVWVSDKCYVYGMLPATEGFEDKKAIAFISHMDTSPDFCGENVKPQIIENYDGGDVLLKGSGEYIKISDFPVMATLKGRTLITSDGTTLLGADDKAGIAAILTAAEDIINNNLPHGEMWFVFTPDEEIGEGSFGFDFDYCKADYAYTVDGGYEGMICYENFNAASAVWSIKGNSVHPGEAKDILVNAGHIAAEIAMMMPADEVPEKTELREGYIHLCEMKGNVASATLQYIIRDFDDDLFEAKKNLMLEIEKKINEKYGEGTAKVEMADQYLNMYKILKDHMYIVDLAREAIIAQGLEPVSEAERGGTDGSTLSFLGLPCPNLGPGGYAFHGPYEHCTVEGMENSVKVIKQIIANPPQK